MRKIVNINDIARLAGVSRSTVSRVLTDNKNVKRETALKVRKAMEEANYRPNILARGLATGRLNLIAMLISEPENPFYLQMVHRLDAELRERGFLLSICYLGPNERARCENFRVIQEYGFAGFVIGDIRDEPALVEEVKASRRPLVFCNRYIESLDQFDAVVSDNYLGGRLAARHFLELGHRRPGILTGPLKSSASRDRYRGFRDALAEYGHSLDPMLVEESDLTLAGGAAFAERFFPAHRDDCDALFAGNDTMAIAILNYCREHGIRVPEDLSLIGFDDLAYAGSPLINLTTLQQPYAKMSELVAERIVARINGETPDRECIMLEPKLIIRKSTAAR